MKQISSIVVALIASMIIGCSKGEPHHDSSANTNSTRGDDSINQLISQARREGAAEARADAEKSNTLHTPGRNDPERKAILDALRVVVETELSQSVIFQVDYLQVKDGWAFMRGTPKQSNGSAVDYNRSSLYRDAWREGTFDDGICALLRKKGDSWYVIEHVIGATDVPYVDWWQQFKAPREIFDHTE